MYRFPPWTIRRFSSPEASSVADCDPNWPTDRGCEPDQPPSRGEKPPKRHPPEKNASCNCLQCCLFSVRPLMYPGLWCMCDELPCVRDPSSSYWHADLCERRDPCALCQLCRVQLTAKRKRHRSCILFLLSMYVGIPLTVHLCTPNMEGINAVPGLNHISPISTWAFINSQAAHKPKNTMACMPSRYLAIYSCEKRKCSKRADSKFP